MEQQAVIEPVADLEPLHEVRGILRKKFDKKFIDELFDKRDKQLFPRDLLAAYLPTRRSRRPIPWNKKIGKIKDTAHKR